MSSDRQHEPLDIQETLPSVEADEETLELLINRFEKILAETTFYDWMELEVEYLEPGRAGLRLPFDETVTTPSPPAPPTIHGGIISTLVDLSGIGAVMSARGGMVGVASVNLNVDFHDRVTESVIADAIVVNEGARLGTAQVSVYPAESNDPDPVATGQTTVRLSELNE
jgi:uncharacterized protein (TIGR00369 family)